MFYSLHEAQRSLINPFSYWSEAVAQMFSAQESWLSQWPGAQRIAAASELLYRIGKDYEKPEFGIHQVQAHGQDVAVLQHTVLEMPFCRLLRFKRYSAGARTVAAVRSDPVVLVVAPLSGHHSTLLRDTVRTLLQDHKVYITDWVDARMVPTEQGDFHLDTYIDYIRAFITHIGAENLHIISVCQPTVPVLASVSLMASGGETTPASLTMMGGPIDPRRNPTKVNDLALNRPLSWFRNTVVHPVPGNYPGHGRRVYPGFLQHTGFIAMNPGRHCQSHWDFYRNLLRGDLDDADAHRRFYDEYNAVLDMAADYYLETIDVVFQQHLLPKGQWVVNGQPVRPQDITRGALLTIEGEFDDISGAGQTEAAHELCSGIAAANQQHFTVEGAGHYGIFNGRRWRQVVYPQLRDFIRAHHHPVLGDEDTDSD